MALTVEQATAEPFAGGVFVANVGEAFGAAGLPEDWFTGTID